MTKQFSVPRGTADILPPDIPFWQQLEATARSILKTYGFSEIRTPIYEDISLFKRSLGQTSDVVNKQLLEIASVSAPGEEKKDNEYALRPEGTAAVVRSYIENRLDVKENLSKLFYVGPMFRGERPQKGRLRQFHQIGVEAIGPNSTSAYLDAEVIMLAMNLVKAFGVDLSKVRLKVNSLGTPEDKENLAKTLRAAFQDKVSQLCEDCQNRFDRNVFRILDCKNKQCQDIVNAYEFTDEFMSESSRQYYQTVREVLNDFKIAYEHTPKLVRGLDYYTHVVFEISHSGLGSQDAIGAGGRYNNLVSDLGCPQAADAIGFALGIERILLAIPDENKPVSDGSEYFIASFTDSAIRQAFLIADKIRALHKSCELAYKAGSPKSQMRLADKSGARYVIILGENEISNKTLTIKDMKTGEQVTESLDQFLQRISNK